MENTSEKKTKLKALNPIVLLAIILVIAAIATYIVPAGVYERVMDPTTQREVVNPQSFKYIAQHPVGFFEFFMSITLGMQRAAYIIFFLFLVGGAFGVIEATGAMNACLASVVKRMDGRELVVIPVCMIIFGCGSAFAGNFEEYLVFVPLMIAVLSLIHICDVTELYSTPDGRFPNHHPDPTKRENLPALIAAVKEGGADFGVGFDGDSDRIGVVDNDGEVIWGDRLMALYWSEILPKHPGAVAICEVKSSMALPETVEKLGGRPMWWNAGHSLVKAKMREEHALFSGEVSGHMFFADEYFGYDDAFYAAGRLARIISNTEKTLAELMRDIPLYPSTIETRYDCPDDVKFGVVERVKEAALAEKLNTITVDGVRIIYKDGWGLVRVSNTQPVLVARCEGRTKEALDEITKDMKRRLLAAGSPDFEWGY